MAPLSGRPWLRALALIGLALLGAVAWIGWGIYTFAAGREFEWQPPSGAAPATAPATREPCLDRTETRRAWFGDLHVHTGLSWDAMSRDVRTGPDDAYRFATGGSIDLPPYDASGRAARSVSIARPLDFAAVTDHAELLGEVYACVRPGAPGYDSATCRVIRSEESGSVFLPRAVDRMLTLMSSHREDELCGSGAAGCRRTALSAWLETQRAAERWYDPSSSCSFTTFHAYEYSYAPAAVRAHRNIVFRNEIVPELPISAIDAPEPEDMWRKLRALCNDTDTACEAIAIPHNPNHSAGRMFPPPRLDLSLEEQRVLARTRAKLEPIVEMMQIKGESECRSGMFDVLGDTDELCGFEKWRPEAPDCGEDIGWGASLGLGCVSRRDFARYALTEGLREEARIGVNPYKFGMIGSTDSHNGSPGHTDEAGWQGSTGALSATPIQRIAQNTARNPGGLVGVWAEENSRDSLFDAMVRRETFATSGTRISVRFFGGYDFEPSWCERRDRIEDAYAQGVAMGSDLPARPARSSADPAPTFAFSAARDPGGSGVTTTPLQRVQLVKAFVDDEGRFHQRVFDAAGAATPADVDPETCEARGAGADVLCGVWSDPEFDPGRRAVYYARVLENPSCRWTTHQCLALPPDERPAECSGPAVPRFIQERAWSSPIWYSPPQDG